MAQPKDWDQAAVRLGVAYEAGGWARRHRLSGAVGGLAVEVVNGDHEYGDTTDYTVSFPPLGLRDFLRGDSCLLLTSTLRGSGASARCL